MKALRLFKRKPLRAPQPGGDRVSPVPGVEGKMERLGAWGASDVGDSPHDPTPEYIEKAGTPSEDVWAREQVLYRAKNEEEPPA